MKPNENVMQDGTTEWETSHLLHMHDYMHAELHAEFKEYASSVANQRTYGIHDSTKTRKKHGACFVSQISMVFETKCKIGA